MKTSLLQHVELSQAVMQNIVRYCHILLRLALCIPFHSTAFLFLPSLSKLEHFSIECFASKDVYRNCQQFRWRDLALISCFTASSTVLSWEAELVTYCLFLLGFLLYLLFHKNLFWFPPSFSMLCIFFYKWYASIMKGGEGKQRKSECVCNIS